MTAMTFEESSCGASTTTLQTPLEIMSDSPESEVYSDFGPDAATRHVMELARQTLPMGLKVAEKNGAAEASPSISSLMIRNVPTLYTPEELRADLESLGMCGGRDFDFLYLPLNAKKRRRNRGYAFLNLQTTRAKAVILGLHNTYLPKHKTPLRPLGICASDVQGFEANWTHFAHVSLTFGRSRPCDGPIFWKNGKEFGAKWDDTANMRTEATLGTYAVGVALASMRFCVMCGEPRRSHGRFCLECGWDLLAYYTQTAYRSSWGAFGREDYQSGCRAFDREDDQLGCGAFDREDYQSGCGAFDREDYQLGCGAFDREEYQSCCGAFGREDYQSGGEAFNSEKVYSV